MSLPIFTSDWTHTPGPDVTFDCPGCETREVAAGTQDSEERIVFLLFVPFRTTRFTRLTCRRCGRSFRLVLPLEEALALGPAALSRRVREEIGFLFKACILIGLFFCFVPVFATVVSGIGLLGVLKKTTGWRTAAGIGFGLSLLGLIAFGLLMAYAK